MSFSLKIIKTWYQSSKAFLGTFGCAAFVKREKGESPIFLFTWYQSQRGKPNFFFGDHVSFRSLYSPFETLCHRRRLFPDSSSLADDLKFRGARGRSTRRRKPHRKTVIHAPPRAALLWQPEFHVPARDPLSGAKIPPPGLSGAVLLIHPSSGPPQAFLPHLFGNFDSAAPPSIALLHDLGHFSSSQVPQP